MTKFKSIFFDMDQTLARDSHSARLSSQRVIPLIQARGLRQKADEIELIYRAVNTRHWEDFDQSPLAAIDCSLKARAVIWGEVLQTLGIDDPEFTLHIAEQFQAARDETYQVYDDTLAALAQLKQKVPLVLVTNGHSQMQRKKIELTGLEPYFDHIFVAQEVGCSKPHPPIFQKALETTNIAPHEALMVGDHPDKDIRGPKQLGIKTAWITRYDSRQHDKNPQADYTIDNLTQLLSIIEEPNAQPA